MVLDHHHNRALVNGEVTALKPIAVQIEGVLETEQWYQKLDEEARAQYRYSGRNLLQGLLGILSADGPFEDSEARSLGYEYASRGWRFGRARSR